MGLVPICLYRYDVALARPLVLRAQTLTRRSGLLLSQEIDGELRWGEAAPLPGFSTETLEDVIEAARQQQWHRWPSLRFAYDSLHYPMDPITVPLNALVTDGDLPDGDASLARKLQEIGQWPHQAIKLKVGRPGRLKQEVRLVRDLRHALRPEQSLRLDANRAWDLQDARTFANALADIDLEYIEEPTTCSADFEDLWRETGLKYALDETLRDPMGNSLNSVASFDPQRLADLHPHAAAWILKPTLGDPVGEHLLDTNTPCPPLVFSACFESGIGLAHLAHLAARFSSGVPAGLDTHRWWSLDLCRTPLSFRDGKLSLPYGRIEVRHELLEEIAP